MFLVSTKILDNYFWISVFPIFALFFICLCYVHVISYSIQSFYILQIMFEYTFFFSHKCFSNHNTIMAETCDSIVISEKALKAFVWQAESFAHAMRYMRTHRRNVVFGLSGYPYHALWCDGSVMWIEVDRVREMQMLCRIEW